MTISLHDNQGRDWTVEGDWSAQVVGADFDGRGQILIWIAPESEDAHLEPAAAAPAPPEELGTGSSPALPPALPAAGTAA